MSEQTIGAAAQYREMMQSRPPEIVIVKVPSGFPFRFQKPNAFGLIFDERAGLPQAAASEAVAAWEEQGVVSSAEDAIKDATQIKVEKKILDTVDRVCELSHQPKIVLGEPQNANEIRYTEIAPDDLKYIYQWVAAGGSAAAMAAMFPERRESNALASASRKKRR